MFSVVFKNLGEIGGNILSVSGNSLEFGGEARRQPRRDRRYARAQNDS